jgi:alpha-L-arabinofuranosidase
MNTGTPEEASNWVEYCNGSGNTPLQAFAKNMVILKLTR